jgi:hypothetical protein
MEGGRTGEDPEEVDGVFFVGTGEDVADDDEKTKAESVFFVGAAEEAAKDDTNTKAANDDTTNTKAANVDNTNTKAASVFFVGAGEDRTGEENANGNTEPKDVFFGVGDSTHEVRTSTRCLLVHGFGLIREVMFVAGVLRGFCGVIVRCLFVIFAGLPPTAPRWWAV